MAQVNYEDNGLVLITKSTFSAVSSVSIDNCFSSDYSQYKILVDGSTATASSSWNMRLRVGGSDNSSANYNRQVISAAGASTVGARYTSETSFVTIFRGNLNSRPISITEILNPFENTYTTAFSQISFDIENSIFMNLHNYGTTVTTSYDGFTLYASSANNITGTVYVYGYKES